MENENIEFNDTEQDLAKDLAEAGFLTSDSEPVVEEGNDGAEESQEVQDKSSDEEGSEEDSSVEKEPKDGDEPAEKEPAEEPKESVEQKLILGKFRSQEELEKAYTNLEKMASKKAAQVSDAQKFASPDNVQKMILEKTEAAAQKRFEDAIATIQDPEQLKEATAAFAMYRRTGDMAYIEKARGFLDRRVDRQLETSMRNDYAQIASFYNQRRTEIELAPVAQSLQELEAEDPEWLADESHQKILADAIRLNRQVDVKSVKRMIVDVEENAVKKYIASENRKKALEVEKKQQISVAQAGRQPAPAPKKDWREMTIEEQLREELAENL